MVSAVGNQVVLVTGGSRGIGAATVLRCARAGYDVAFTYREQAAAARRVAAQVESLGRRALSLEGDVSDEGAVQGWFQRTRSELGSLDALVNNAGIVAPQQRLEAMSAARVRRMLEVNVVGAFLCAREAVRHMSRKHAGNGGCIVNVSSAASYLGSPGEYIDYAASKGALDTLTIGLAKEVAAEGIRVNAVRPGLIDTEIHADSGEPGRVARLASQLPMKRGGTAEEVAEVIAFLLSEAASYVTGSLVNCSGGR